MGERGPIPKRSEERRRRNEPESGPVVKVEIDEEPPEIPVADESWHPLASAWYDSLRVSGQSRFYEPSDWATAYIVAESMSRDLKPQVVGIVEETGEVIRAVVPLKGTSLSAYLKAMAVLLVTEGDRRRASIELQRPQPGDGDGTLPAGVTSISSRREAMLSGR